MFENVIIGVDGRSGGRDAIALGRQLAEPGAKVSFAQVYGTGGMVGRGGGPGMAFERETAQQELAEAREKFAGDAELEVIMGPTVGRALHELAASEHADLLVIGSCHRGRLGRVLVGNDVTGTLHGSPCAVAIAPSGYESNRPRLSTVGVGEDPSPESARALEVAIELGGRLGAVIRPRSVIPLQEVPSAWGVAPPDWLAATEQRVHEERARLQEVDNVDGDALYGKPTDQLLALSREVDLLVVGSRGLGPVEHVMSSSTSDYLAHHVHCPLLVVPRAKAAAPQTTTTSAGVGA
jgi:nucleotide-binding universal stress UspA family protein